MSVKFTAGFLTQTQADALNRLFAKPTLGDVWAVPPLQMTRGPSGQPAISLPPPESWWAKLTDEDAGAWTHEEWWESEPGTWEKKPLGVTGTLDAYPVGGKTGTEDVIVRMWQSRSVPDVYEFDPGADASDTSFWAEITSGPSTNAYSWKQIVLSAGVYVDASPPVTGSANAYPTYVATLAPFVQAGTQVRMWPSPTQSGKYEFEPLESGFFAQITNGPSSGAYSWKQRVNIAGVWSDLAGFTGTYNAYPVELDGSTPAVELGTTVWMWRSTSGKFVFQVFQPASYDVPGLVTTAAQTFRGDKTFRLDSMAVIGDGSNDVAFYVGSLGAITVGQVGSGMTVDLLGGNSDSNAGMVSVGGGVSASAYTVRYDLTHAASFYVTLNGSGNVCVGVGGNFGSAFDAFQYDPTTQIFSVGGTSGSLRVSDDVRVDTGGSYYVGTAQGQTVGISITDQTGGVQSMTFTGGILTAQSYSPPPSPPSAVGEILTDGGIDGGTW